MSQNNVSCPVDFVSINENKVRLIALHVFVISVLLLLYPNWILLSVLTLDFFLRTFSLNKFSPFAVSAAGIIRIFAMGFKPVDQGPKRFAAGIGLTFSIAMLISYSLDYPAAVFILTATLTLFSFLETFVAFCAGCYVYTFLVRTFKVQS